MRIIKKLKNVIPQFESLENCWKINWLGNEYLLKIKTIKKVLYEITNFSLLVGVCSISGLFPCDTFEEFYKCLVMAMFIGIMNVLTIVQDRENDDID